MQKSIFLFFSMFSLIFNLRAPCVNGPDAWRADLRRPSFGPQSQSRVLSGPLSSCYREMQEFLDQACLGIPEQVGLAQDQINIIKTGFDLIIDKYLSQICRGLDKKEFNAFAQRFSHWRVDPLKKAQRSREFRKNLAEYDQALALAIARTQARRAMAAKSSAQGGERPPFRYSKPAAR